MMKLRSGASWRHAPLAVLAAVVSACAGADSPDVLASAEDAQLTVSDAVALLENQPELPANRQVIRALAELWVDYTLLAEATAEDSTLANLDVDVIIQQRVDQDMIRALREAVIEVDTVLDDQQLRYLYEQEKPGATVRARHILLTFDQTDPASREQAISQAQELRQRLVDGADFAELAEDYSKDPGTAQQGGDLGVFTRERMLPAFSDAAFSLDPGEISQPVETMFGIHIIRVDSREVPAFEDLKEGFRNAIKNERIARAESTYVTGIEEPAAVTIAEGALDIARSVADDPGAPLPNRATNKPMVEYVGGAFTVGEFREFMQNQSPAYRAQVAEATDGQLETALRGLTRGKLLVERARAEGLEPPAATVDSLRTATRAEIADAARRLGVLGEGATADPQATIRTALVEMLKGERDVIPLGQVGFALGERFSSRINDDAVGEASRRIEEARSQVPVAPPALPTIEKPSDSTPTP